MKVKFILLQWAMLLLLLNANAQQKKLSKHWSFQITTGAQFNYFTDEQPHRSISAGTNAQFRINYALKKGWGLFAEGGYAGTGGNLVSFTDNTFLGFDPTIQFKNGKQSDFVIHTLESSLGLSYTIPTKLSWKLKVYAAPQWNVNLGEWERYEKTGAMLTLKPTDPTVIGTIQGQQFTDLFEPYWFSALGGLQFELPIKRNAFLVDFRFVNGLSPARYDYSYINKSGIQGNIRTNSFRVAVGYLIPGHAAHKKTSSPK
ncbi:MAG: outer membrane beta-barrel protein [Chitinophagaceae bacterium]|nr:outer membrane beta-barrel protein [Chitinophagaceae bacterium]